jgi:hypothetical protein
MNPLERILQDDLHRLVDRLAATTCEGALAACAERYPEIRDRLDGAEARLSALRERLLDDYAAWREALDTCADVWAVAALSVDEPQAVGRRAA